MKDASQKIVSENQKTWDKVADLFVNASELPAWGPFGIGDDLNLIPKIEGKTFLEIGCGSGRSIKYLTEKGAKKVCGLDVSTKQIEEAITHNQGEINQGKVKLIRGSMEEKIDIEPVDFVFSIYAIGWTPEPEKTLKNIYSYLKPGGLFVWSWDHTFFTDVQFKDGKFIVVYSYHEENSLVIKNWKKEGATANITYRKTSTWFQLLRDAGFEIVGYYEPKPKNLSRGHDDPTRYYSLQKAEKIPCSFIFVCKKNKI
jgi:SAM-dependent methyltransferase